jgi:hypothetical protein
MSCNEIIDGSHNWLSIPKDIIGYIFQIGNLEIGIMMLVSKDIKMLFIHYFPKINVRFDLGLYGANCGSVNIIRYAIGVNDCDVYSITRVVRKYIGPYRSYIFDLHTICVYAAVHGHIEMIDFVHQYRNILAANIKFDRPIPYYIMCDITIQYDHLEIVKWIYRIASKETQLYIEDIKCIASMYDKLRILKWAYAVESSHTTPESVEMAASTE